MKKKSNLTLFMKQLIRSLKEEERFSTAHIYQSTLNAFSVETGKAKKNMQNTNMPCGN